MSASIPREFILGAATSAYQIEGDTERDGRGPSIWDTFTATTSNILDGTSGRDACRHHQLYASDVELMHWLGLEAYRFSIAWPRVLPEGRGALNEAGLDFYDRLVDSLLAKSIAPFATLYHWDLPQALEDTGGWRARDTAHAFADYAELVARRLGDRVVHWITHNEPWCVAMHGHVHGVHAPGHRSWAEGLVVAHHVLLSHGLAVPAIRAHVPRAEVGITLNFNHCEPLRDDERDRDACRALDGTFNRWYIDPLYGRGYPEDVIADHVTRGALPGATLPFVKPGDLRIIAVETDFLGVNYYTRALVGMNGDGTPFTAPAALACTDIGWEVYADGLRQLLLRLETTYRPTRMYVTENGAAYHTAPDADGCVQDGERLRYLHDHLAAVLAAREAGACVDGYFAWSLLDNFEWAEGYTQRFGMVWVDFETQQRIPKQSAHWYRALIETRRL